MGSFLLDSFWMGAFWMAKDVKCLQADNKDSDQNVCFPVLRLICFHTIIMSSVYFLMTCIHYCII